MSDNPYNATELYEEISTLLNKTADDCSKFVNASTMVDIFNRNETIRLILNNFIEDQQANKEKMIKTLVEEIDSEVRKTQFELLRYLASTQDRLDKYQNKNFE